jgi:hypothetical protein
VPGIDDDFLGHAISPLLVLTYYSGRRKKKSLSKEKMFGKIKKRLAQAVEKNYERSKQN